MPTSASCISLYSWNILHSTYLWNSIGQPISITGNFLLTSQPIRITGNSTLTTQPTNQSWYNLVNFSYTTLPRSYLQNNHIASPIQVLKKTGRVLCNKMLCHFKSSCKSCQSSWSWAKTGNWGRGNLDT